MRIIILIALIAHSVRASTLPTQVTNIGVLVRAGTSCTTDADCAIANAVCWPTTGNTRGDSRCACRFGLTWSNTDFRCITPRNITTITRDPLAYEEQWLERATPHQFPRTWMCDDVSRYCWASQGGVSFVSIDPVDWWHIRYAIAGITRIPFGRIIWACDTTREAYLSDNAAATSTYGSGLRAAEEHCSPCSDRGYWCGIHGSCSSNWVCTCMDGWSGDRCDVPPRNLTARSRASVGGYNDSVPCDPLGVNSCGINEECAFLTENPSKGYCTCKAGSIRSALSNTYAQYSSPSGGGTITDKIPQLCIASNTTKVYVGAPVDTPGVGVADVYFSTDDPSVVWWFDGDSTRHIARVEIPVDLSDPTWYPRRFIQRLFRCSDAQNYHRPPSVDLFAGGVCRGRSEACGFGAADTSDRHSGSCICTGNTQISPSGRCDLCKDGWAGLHCTQTTTECSIEKCSGAGTCYHGEYEYQRLYESEVRVTGLIAGSKLGEIPCICNNRAIVTPWMNCTSCRYLLRDPDNQLIISDTPTLTTIPSIESVVSGCVCSPGFGGSGCRYAPENCNALFCSSNGRCVETPRGTECACVPSYSEQHFGLRCTDSLMDCRTKRCSGHGTCIAQNQGCVCDPWWGGADCSTRQCANGQPYNNDTGVCECSPSFYGPACQYWTCNYDSYIVDGTCTCRGQWIPDGSGNCTKSMCGSHGQPYPGVPNSCHCNNYADFRSVAPYCLPRCTAEQSVRASDGNCTCKFGYSGPVCEQAKSDFPFPFGSVSIAAVVISSLVGGIIALSMAHSFY